VLYGSAQGEETQHANDIHLVLAEAHHASLAQGYTTVK
jgi:hypothetical protein